MFNLAIAQSCSESFHRESKTINITQPSTKTEAFSSNSSADWTPGTNLSLYGCDIDGMFTVFTHGWNDQGMWVEPFIQNILKYREGCVVYLNYSNCFDMTSYFKTYKRWREISSLLLIMLHAMENEGVSSDNIFMYGFSLGARAVIDAAITFGKQKIGYIDGIKLFLLL